MQLLIWIIFGGVVGWVASIIMNTNAQQGVLINIIVGIIGAILGGWIMTAFGQNGGGGTSLYSFLVALLGAVVFIAIAKAVRS